MKRESAPPTLARLRSLLAPFCRKHHIRRLDVFGSAARGACRPGSDIDLLVTLEESPPTSTGELLEIAGEVEEILGRPVDFVLRQAIEHSPNSFAREQILASAVCVYGN